MPYETPTPIERPRPRDPREQPQRKRPPSPPAARVPTMQGVQAAMFE